MKKNCLPVLLGLLVPALAATSHADFQNPGGLRIGDQAIAIDSSKQVTIIGMQPGGVYAIRDAFGNTYSNIAASDLAVESGCYGGICAAQKLIAVDSLKQVTVLALEQNGSFVIQDVFSNIYVNIAASDLAVETGCAGGLCVSQEVIAVDSVKAVTILGLESNGTFVVQDVFSNMYANIVASDLAVKQGCYGNLCVGQQAIALDSSKTVTIIALQSNGEFVIQDAFSNIYANIGASDLASMQAPRPQPPMPQPPRPQPPMPFPPQPPRPFPPMPQPQPPRPPVPPMPAPGGPGQGPGEFNPNPHPVLPPAPVKPAPAPVQPAPAPSQAPGQHPGQGQGPGQGQNPGQGQGPNHP